MKAIKQGGFLLFAIGSFYLMLMLVSGCSPIVEEDTNTQFKTVQEAALESELAAADVFHTEELSETAFAFYQSQERYGILHFSLKEDGWDYQGSSGHATEGDRKPFSFSQSTWHKGDASTDHEGSYTTVFFGEMSDPEIKKMTIDYRDGKRDANLIRTNGRAYWYLVSEQDDGTEGVDTVSAYSAEGELLYRRGE
ncbi:hypothetical protein M3212_14315 [Alkalihalobacillus oceani]|uniref:hypothetical protein n=1 Tax=Halalkalibacter oceani TaxID=1653776 RepID=UPI0020424B64|nr:hypothetical protein [Halalkalibacter oceani]MCM3761946.1 hypothetical protein [Halalkalibacter oceani]